MQNKNLQRLIDKTASFKGFMQGATNAAVVGTLLSLGANTFNSIKNKIQNDLRRKSLLEDLMRNDPIISKADKDQVLQFYATIFHVAPHLSADKNTVKDLLRNFITFDKVDLNSIKMLADAEKNMGTIHGSGGMDPIQGLTAFGGLAAKAAEAK